MDTRRESYSNNNFDLKVRNSWNIIILKGKLLIFDMSFKTHQIWSEFFADTGPDLDQCVKAIKRTVKVQRLKSKTDFLVC